MTGHRALIAAAVATALMAHGVLAANDPRGLDLRDDADRPPPLLGRAAVPPPAMTEQPLRGNPLWGIPLDTLRETRERPLFSPSRRPPAAAVIAPSTVPVKAAAPAAEPDRPPLDLVGVVIGTGGSASADGAASTDAYAVFVNTATHDVIRLRTGEGHDGWVLQSVQGREAVLEKDHRTAVIALPAPTGSKK